MVLVVGEVQEEAGEFFGGIGMGEELDDPEGGVIGGVGWAESDEREGEEVEEVKDG